MCVNLRKGQGVDMFPRTENKVDLFPRTGTIVTSLSRYRATWRRVYYYIEKTIRVERRILRLK